MSSGVGYHKLAIVGTLLAGLVLIIFSKDKISFFLSNQYMLQFIYSSSDPDTDSFHRVLSGHCKRYEIINIRTNESAKTMEYSYNIFLMKNKDVDKLLLDLGKVKGIRSTNLFFDQLNS